jgi:hypothetical protein
MFNEIKSRDSRSGEFAEKQGPFSSPTMFILLSGSLRNNTWRRASAISEPTAKSICVGFKTFACSCKQRKLLTKARQSDLCESNVVLEIVHVKALPRSGAAGMNKRAVMAVVRLPKRHK